MTPNEQIIELLTKLKDAAEEGHLQSVAVAYSGGPGTLLNFNFVGISTPDLALAADVMSNHTVNAYSMQIANAMEAGKPEGETEQ